MLVYTIIYMATNKKQDPKKEEPIFTNLGPTEFYARVWFIGTSAVVTIPHHMVYRCDIDPTKPVRVLVENVNQEDI